MFCPRCGKQLDDNAVVCVGCGCSVANAKTAQNDAPSGLFALLGFFIPVVGLILYLIYNDTAPLKAKSAGKGALIGFIVGIVLSVVLVVLYIFGFSFLMFNVIESAAYY